MKLRRYCLMGMWLLSLVIISYYGGTVSYGLFFAISLVPVISLLYTFCVYLRFRIFQQIESREIICRQPVSYYFVLQNEDHYGFASVKAKMFTTLSYVEDIPDDMEYELLPGDRYTYQTKLVCRYRGEYEIGIKEVMITDFFRLFTFRYKITGTIKALVQPRKIHLDQPEGLSELIACVQRENRLLDTEPDVVVRDYAPGDPIRSIHWKATAKERKLKVRNRVGEEKQMISLFYDTERYSSEITEYLPPENQVLETVLALGLFLAEKNAAYTLIDEQNSMGGRAIQGVQDYGEFYRLIAGTQFDAGMKLDALINQAARQTTCNHSRILIGVLQSLTEERLVLLASLLNRGIFVLLYIVTDENLEELVKQGNDRLRIRAVPVHAELKDVL